MHSSRPLIILENIRSAYNVGNIIRTADALWYDVVLSWFTPHPEQNGRVVKTSLGAEQSVKIQHFWNPVDAVRYVTEQWYMLVVGECCEGSSPLAPLLHRGEQKIAILVWNENTGVLQETIDVADYVVHIPMRGIKESLNVGQAAAILMWAHLS